jgi:anti-sigma regulatory factor (Ser/Thr protein kinase)
MEPAAEAVRLVRGQVRSLLCAHGWSEEPVEAALLGLDEVLTNACSHGAAAENGEAVELSVELHADRIVFEVRDRGSFTPGNGKEAAPLPDDESESGRGLFLIHATMDEVRFEAREGGGTRVRLVKRR